MEPLLDPTKDRVIKSIKAPPHRPLPRELMFPEKLKGKPDWRLIKDHLHKEGRIAKEELVKLIQDTNKIFKNEGNLLYVQDPITVVGDIHGQFYDSIKMLEIGGNPDNTKYLFLGDFVDRGSFSIEVVILFYSLKLAHPDTIHMLRGNHECRQMTTFFNFRAECLYKYDQEIYDLVMDSFDMMPLACVVNGKFLAVHGGLSPELKTIDDINKIDRFKEPPRQGIFCDLLWADPVDNEDGICENIYRTNDVRGCSYFYGNEAVAKFLDNNNLLSVIRAHEAQIDGYKMHTWTGKSDFPVVITIFSAPNYCDVYNNKGAVIIFENNTLNIQQFNYTAHPYVLPNFMDIFTWSLPFVTEKVTEMLLNLINPGDDNDDDDDDDDSSLLDIPGLPKETIPVNQAAIALQKRGEILRNKVKFVSKMVKLSKNLRENREGIIQDQGVSPDAKIKLGPLKNNNANFNTVKRADLVNEKRPGM